MKRNQTRLTTEKNPIIVEAIEKSKAERKRSRQRTAHREKCPGNGLEGISGEGLRKVASEPGG